MFGGIVRPVAESLKGTAGDCGGRHVARMVTGELALRLHSVQPTIAGTGTSRSHNTDLEPVIFAYLLEFFMPNHLEEACVL